MATTATTAPAVVEPAPGPSPPRVSPFVLPASTTSQFLLLVTLAATVAAFTWDQIVGGADFWSGEFRVCVDAGDRLAGLPVSALEITRTYVDCYDGVLLERVRAGLLGVGLVLALVVVGVAAHPRLLVRREGLVRFEPAEFPDAVADIERCVSEAGLQRRPEFYYEAFRSDRGGRAFGTGRRPRVRLALQVLPIRGATEADRAVLRAVLRHELAHVRNRDLTLTAMVVVVPYVFLAAVVVPMMVKLALHSPGELWSYGWRLAAMLGLILLVRASVFRAREHYADVRASVNGPSAESAFLASAFPDDARTGRVRRLARLVQGRVGLRPHPRPSVRSAVVDRPARLLDAGVAEGAAAGVTAGVTSYFLRNLLVGLVDANLLAAAAVAGIAVGGLVATVTGQSMWRAALAASVEGRPVPNGARTAVGLAAGLLVAEYLAPAVLSQGPALVARDVTASLVTVAVLVIGCLVYTRWCATSATTWLAASHAGTLRPALRGGLVVGAVVFGAPYAAWSLAVSSAAVSASPLRSMTIWVVNPPFALALVAAAAFPLIAAWPAGRGADRARPLLLDPPYRLVLAVPRLRPALVLVPAVLVAVAYLALDAAVFRGAGVFRILEAFDTPGGTAPTEAVANAQVAALVGFLLAAEILVVVGVAAALARGRVLGTWTHLLAAAVVAGHLVAIAFPAYPLITACTPETCSPRFLAIAFGVLSLATTLAATLVAVPVWLLAAGAEQLRRAATRTRPGPPPPMRPPRHSGVVARTASATGWAAGGMVGLTYAVAVTLALLFVFNLVGSGRNADLPPDVRQAPADRSPTSYVVACGAVNSRSLAGTGLALRTDYGLQLRIARTLAAVTDSGVLRSVGAAKERALLDGATPAALLADRALVPLCANVPAAELPTPR